MLAPKVSQLTGVSRVNQTLLQEGPANRRVVPAHGSQAFAKSIAENWGVAFEQQPTRCKIALNCDPEVFPFWRTHGEYVMLSHVNPK